MLYAYRSHTFLNSILVHILNDLGEIINVHEFASVPAAKKYLMQWHGNNLEWIDQPWTHEQIQGAFKKYKENTGVNFNGR